MIAQPQTSNFAARSTWKADRHSNLIRPVTFIIVPLSISFARVYGTTLDTIWVYFPLERSEISSSGDWVIEVIIWLVASGQVMNTMTTMVCCSAYGAGFATGTFIGMAREEKIPVGLTWVRTITGEDPQEMMQLLSSHNYGVTRIDGEGVPAG